MIEIDTFIKQFEKEFGIIKNTQTKIEIESILSYNKLPYTKHQLAYILATAYHETAFDFIPKLEHGSRDYFITRYWNNQKVKGWLGNTNIYDAYIFCGRGKVQITGRRNYTIYGIEDEPEKACDTELSTHILFHGMLQGIFTGRKLRNYINDTKIDFVNARKVVNGTDKAEKIASYAEKFCKLL